MVNFLQQTIKQPEHLYTWVQTTVTNKASTVEQAAVKVGLFAITLKTDDIIDRWTAIYDWCCEHSSVDDFQLYWAAGLLIGIFRNSSLALMYKLRWG
jgi:hypothetical protein